MGNRPSAPSAAQHEELERRQPELSARAACAINQADVLIVATGAGWSADSGLAIYRDVADVAAYRERGLTYRDICQPQYLEEDPALFHGFWGGCYNDYRNVQPHEGYSIIKRWVERRFRYSEAAAALRTTQTSVDDGEAGVAAANGSISSHAGAFFAYTSNVDAHWHTAGFGAFEVLEIHGNCERWQCAERCIGEQWSAPPAHRFRVDETTRLAPQGTPLVAPGAPVHTTHPHASAAFGTNWPTCVRCGGDARPAVLMFGDTTYQGDDAADSRWEEWRLRMAAACRDKGYTVAILEVGCGGNVTTVRMQTESILEELTNGGVDATLIRVNPELPLADQPDLACRVLPILSSGLAAVRRIDALMAAPAPDTSPEAGYAPPTARSFRAPLEGFHAGGLEPESSAPPHAFGAPLDGGDEEEEDEEEDEDVAMAEGTAGAHSTIDVGARADAWTLPDAKKAAHDADTAAQAKLDKLRALLKGVDTDLASSSASRGVGAVDDEDNDDEGGAAMNAWERFARYPARAAEAKVAAANAAAVSGGLMPPGDAPSSDAPADASAPSVDVGID